MNTESPPHVTLPWESFLEYAFLRWILAPATRPEIVGHVKPQRELDVDGRQYRLDYEIRGATHTIAVELDGFEFHSSRPAFSYDRLRQNDIQATGRVVLRFSYDSVRLDTGRCVAQLQTILDMDPLLADFVVPDPVIERPEMDPDPLRGLLSSAFGTMSITNGSYFDTVRDKLNQNTLRDCQTQGFAALANYYLGGGKRAACVMSVGAGKKAT